MAQTHAQPTQSRMPEVILDSAPIMLDYASKNTAEARLLRKRAMQKSALQATIEFLTATEENQRRNAGRTAVLASAAIVQLGAKEDYEPAVERITRQINEIVPLAAVMQDPPVDFEPFSSDDVAQYLQDSLDTMRMHTRMQPHDLSVWPYDERVLALQTNEFYFADKTSAQ